EARVRGVVRQHQDWRVALGREARDALYDLRLFALAELEQDQARARGTCFELDCARAREVTLERLFDEQGLEQAPGLDAFADYEQERPDVHASDHPSLFDSTGIASAREGGDVRQK